LTAVVTAAPGAPPGPARVGPLAPFTIPIFRALWIAAFVSYIGSWMQTVGAQWYLIDGSASPLVVALIQAASAGPVLLLGVPAGVLGELLNRRTVLIWAQAAQVAISAALVGLTWTDELSPYLLLILTFMLGVTTAIELPAYQTLTAEIIPAPFIPNAASLSAISINLARAVGPAIAGIALAAFGITFVFALNLASLAVFLLVLVFWRTYRQGDAQPERFSDATRAGLRYVANSGVVRRLYMRLGAFVLPASALYALLPLVASDRLGLDSTGYGALLGAIGVGAVGAAFSIPPLRDRWGANVTVLVSSVSFGAASIVVAIADSVWTALPALVVAGSAWVGVIATLNGAAQSFIPSWVRVRGLSVAQMVLFGATAAGAAMGGLLSTLYGTSSTLAATSLLVILAAVSQLFWPLLSTADKPREPARLPLGAAQRQPRSTRPVRRWSS
jgi:MFS family permease